MDGATGNPRRRPLTYWPVRATVRSVDSTLYSFLRLSTLSTSRARQPDALNPDYWAMDGYAFSIETSRVFMSRLFMNLTTNIQHTRSGQPI